MKENLFKTMRSEAGLSQRAVAKRLGYTSPQFVSNWERGLADPPASALPALAKVFGKEPQDFFKTYEDLLVAKYRAAIQRKLKKVGRG